MNRYICLDCGYFGDYEDFNWGSCPACRSENLPAVICDTNDMTISDE
jgi:predicted Zn-ribbon and HTH transcriptional regulator